MYNIHSSMNELMQLTSSIAENINLVEPILTDQWHGACMRAKWHISAILFNRKPQNHNVILRSSFYKIRVCHWFLTIKNITTHITAKII